jgi:two-component system LytT family response regulator
MKRPTREPDTKRISKLLEELESGAKYVERFGIKAGEKVFFVRAADIDSIEAQGNYVRVTVGSILYVLRETITSIEAQIDPRTFVRIHRSTIVNMNRVKELQSWGKGEYRVVLHSGACHTLSRGYRGHFENFIKAGEYK